MCHFYESLAEQTVVALVLQMHEPVEPSKPKRLAQTPTSKPMLTTLYLLLSFPTAEGCSQLCLLHWQRGVNQINL